jgi:hypothetical protein
VKENDFLFSDPVVSVLSGLLLMVAECTDESMCRL